MPNIRLALRTLFKSPFVTLVAILSLALGIGANSAIFSLFDQMLLRPLPVPNPEELVNFKSPGPKPGSNSCGQAGGCDEIFSYPMFKDLEKAQTSFTGIAAHRNFGGSVGYQGTSLSGERPAGVGQLFSGARPDAGARTPVHARGRQDRRQPLRRRAQSRLLATPLRARTQRSSTRRWSSTARR